MIEIYIKDPFEKAFCIEEIKKISYTDKKVVIIKKKDDSCTHKQQKLHWKWCSEIAASGMGADDLKEDVYIRCKWQFARPILLRDDDVYPVLDSAFLKKIEFYAEDIRRRFIKEFADRYISIQRMTIKQRAELMTEMYRYWSERGVQLTLPPEGKNFEFKKNKS